MTTSEPVGRILFVNCNVAEGEDKIRHVHNTAKRAHVVRDTHRRRRLEKVKLWNAQGARDESRYGNSSSSPSLQGAQEEPDKRLVRTRVTPKVKARGVNTLVHSSVPSSIESFLGAGRLDPLNSYPAENISIHAHEILDSARSTTWISLVPARGKAILNPVVSAWQDCIRQCPGAFYSFLYCGSLHQTFLRGGPAALATQTLLPLSFKTKAIQYVNQRLQNLTGPAPDALLATILVLAAHEPNVQDLDVRGIIYPQSPMATTQTLDLFGNMVMVPAHMQALYLLVEQRGGLEAIETFGLADILVLGDLLGASLSTTRPGFPNYYPAISLLQSKRLELDDAARALFVRFASGFAYLSLELSPALQPFLGLVSALREASVAIDSYQRSRYRHPELADLVPLRNSIQWRLLSLLPFSPTAILTPQTSIAEVCRLATLIYSDMVIFPLAPASGVRRRLAGLLRAALEVCMQYGVCNLHPDLVLWAVIMGGMAARVQADCLWYREALRAVAEMTTTEATNFVTVSKIISSFLWWDFVCIAPARDFWSETFHERASESLEL